MTRTASVAIIGLVSLIATGTGYYAGTQATATERPFVQWVCPLLVDMLVPNAASTVYSAGYLTASFVGGKYMTWPRGVEWKDPGFRARLPFLLDGKAVWIPCLSLTCVDVNVPGVYPVYYVTANPINGRLTQWTRFVTVE